MLRAHTRVGRRELREGFKVAKRAFTTSLNARTRDRISSERSRVSTEGKADLEMEFVFCLFINNGKGGAGP